MNCWQQFLYSYPACAIVLIEAKQRNSKWEDFFPLHWESFLPLGSFSTTGKSYDYGEYLKSLSLEMISHHWENSHHCEDFPLALERLPPTGCIYFPPLHWEDLSSLGGYHALESLSKDIFPVTEKILHHWEDFPPQGRFSTTGKISHHRENVLLLGMFLQLQAVRRLMINDYWLRDIYTS